MRKFNLILLLATILYSVTAFGAQRNPDVFTARLGLYTDNSVLSSGKWVKVKIEKTGVYKISYSELQSMGFSDPSKVSVFGYGGALLSTTLNANYIDDLPEVPTYRGDSYILFYGQGTIKLNYQSSAMFPYSFSRNEYSDYACYFLTDAKGSQLTVSKNDKISVSADTSLSTYYDVALDMPEEYNVAKTGTVWVGDAITQSGSKSYSFQFPNMRAGGYGAIKMHCVSTAAANSTFSLTSCDTTVSVGVSSGASFETGRYANLYLDDLVLPSGKTLKVVNNYTTSLSTGVGYVHYIEVMAQSDLSLKNGWISIFEHELCTDKLTADLKIGSASANTVIWDITDLQNIKSIPFNLMSDTAVARFTFDNNQRLVAFNPDDSGFLSVSSSEDLPSQNLHAVSDVDMVIISPDKFNAQAEELADLHRTNDTLSVFVVDPEDIYNEFSSGTPDPTAYRAFMKMLYDKANNNNTVRPRYLLLFGDCLYDNRGLLQTTSSDRHNWLLAFQKDSATDYGYVSDDYYGFLADNVTPFNLSADTINIGVGRLPVSTVSEAANAVQKVANYIQNYDPGMWKNSMAIIADDNELRDPYHLFIGYAENMSNSLSAAFPSVLQKKIYYDAYTRVAEANGARYPEVESLFKEQFNNGCMLINYIGHSGTNFLSMEKTFKISDAAALSNKRLGVFLSASCEFARYDGYATSGGEEVILNPNGGAVEVVATPREVYGPNNDRFNSNFVDCFFSQSDNDAMGDIMMRAKNKTAGDSKLTFSLLGDPALRLHLALYTVVTDSILLVGDSSVTVSDTLSPLSHVKVKAHIQNNGVKVDDFNGIAEIVLNDKLQTMSTKGNNSKAATTFTDYPTTLYSGKVNVVDGDMEFEFIVPKDISYYVDNGRLVYYAYDTEHHYEAKGCDKNFYIGGNGDNLDTVDVDGPVVDLYMNTSKFRSGDRVNSTPVFFAKVADKNGINATGSGIGHDITLKLSDGSDVTVLNNYFSYVLGSSTQGTVAYQLPELEPGKYTLTFKVWDMLNNSSTESIDFKVVDGLQPSIQNVSAYPNPAVDAVTISAQTDRPKEVLSYNVYIYDLSGHIVNEFKGSDTNDDGVLTFNWDLKNASGVKVNPGIYVYRVDIKTSESVYVGDSEKIVVLPQ